MPAINRVQVQALLRAGVIDDRVANVYLSRLDAGQTVDVPTRLIQQAEQAAAQPVAGPSALERFAGATTAGTAGLGAVSGIAGLLQQFQAQPVSPSAQPSLFDRPAAEVAPAADVTAPTDGAPLSAAQVAANAILGVGGGDGIAAGITGQVTPLTIDGQTIPGMGINEFGQVVQFETPEQRTQAAAEQARVAMERETPSAQRLREFGERTREQAFIRETEAGRRAGDIELQELRGQQTLEQSAAQTLLQLMSQPGGEFLARAIAQRGQGLTPVFDPTRDLRSLAPEQFASMFQGAQQSGSAIPARGVAGTSAILSALSNQAALDRGGIGATGQQDFSIIPNIRQITGLTEAELAELNAILPQLTGQTARDLSQQVRPPSAGRASATFR